MKTGINWNAFGAGKISDEKQIELLLKNGFESTFADSECEELAGLVKKLNANGITCESCHAPFKGINLIWLPGEAGEAMAQTLINSAEKCAQAGVPVLVCHLSSGDNAPRITDLGYERFKRVVDSAAEKGVTVAFENQRKLANLAFAMEEYPEAGFCWDVGHEKCFAFGREYMPLFASRLKAVHIHDNYAVHNRDVHKLPFDASINYERTAELLAASGYSGAVMLEVFAKTSGDYDDFTAEEYYERAGKAAAKLRDMIAARA